MEVEAGGQLSGSFPILLSLESRLWIQTLDHEYLSSSIFSAAPSTLTDWGHLEISGGGHEM